jgi:exodeoxyribonuclease V
MGLSAGQEMALSRVGEWLEKAPAPVFCAEPECLGYSADGGSDEMPHTHGMASDFPVMSIGGLAGSGKTFVTAMIADYLAKRVTFSTPTNKAASVLRGKLPAEQQSRCGTYHSLLYRPNAWHTCLSSGDTANELQCICGNGFEHDDCSCPKFRCEAHESEAMGCKVEQHLTFDPRPFAGGYRDLIVIDEASMVTEEQVNDIRRFGLPILLVGDHGQLPPVKGQLSPWMKSPDIVLEENFRQQEESGIVRAALMARNVGAIAAGKYGTGAFVASGSSRPDIYNAMLPHRLAPGPDSMIITWTNRGRAEINGKVHQAVALASNRNPNHKVLSGDRLICLGSYQCDVVKPKGADWAAQGWQHRTFNGQAGTVLAVRRQTQKWADVVISLEDPARPSLSAAEQVKVLRRIDLSQLGADRVLRPDERAAGAAAFDYGYCLTAHKSQGSEAEKVVVVGQGPSGPDRSRWLYTAMTRAKSKLIVIL